MSNHIPAFRNAAALASSIALVAALIPGPVSAATIDCEPKVPCIGTKHDDDLVGTRSADRIRGRDGRDSLKGRRGADHLNGGRDLDSLRGGKGPDTLVGGPVGDNPNDVEYSDQLKGNAGHDELHGGVGDWLWGGRGKDVLYGSRGQQRFIGGFGDDVLHLGSGKDWIIPFPINWGDDKIIGSPHFDTVLELSHVYSDLRVNLNSNPNRREVKQIGGSSTIEWANDAIRSLNLEGGDDVVRGNEYDNRIYSHGGSDRIFGSGGDDDINVSYDNGPDFVDCGAGDADEVTYDADTDTVKNCEILHPIA